MKYHLRRLFIQKCKGKSFGEFIEKNEYVREHGIYSKR